MKKVILGAIACAVLVVPAPANAQSVTVEDPTAGVADAFSGEYKCYTYEPEGTEIGEYDAQGNHVGPATGTHVRKDSTCSQTGYVYVGTDGVVACNGNEEITRPDDGSALQGYIWIGPDHAASNPTGQGPGGAFGAGNNHEDADGNPTGDSPCP